MGLSPLRGSLRAAPDNRDGSIIVPSFFIMAISRTTRLFCLSVDRSLRQEVMAAEDVLLKKRGKIRSTDYSVVKEREGAS